MEYCIVGAGPCGLVIAWILSKYNKRVRIIEREETIGGCHRVRRVRGKFTEHGPRIYASSYKNTIKWMREMGIEFKKEFKEYKFGASTIGNRTVKDMRIYEILWFIYEWMIFMINEERSKKMTCEEFMEKRGFTEKTKDYIDRVCRLTDGAGADRYTLYELLQLINQNGVYKIYEPRKPNDEGIMKKIKEELEKRKVKIEMGVEIRKIKEKENKMTIIDKKGREIKADKYILAIPPKEILKIIERNEKTKDILGENKIYREYVRNTNYNIYISVVYHWKKKIEIKRKWGFPLSDWGIAYIIMSDYMKFKNKESKTVISCCITKPESKSRNINKRIDECSEEEIKKEVFRQLKEDYPDLEEADEVIISPGEYKEKKSGKWKTKDHAYFETKEAEEYRKKIKYKNKNIYTVGTQNGKSEYAFTTMESAVINGIKLVHEIIPESEREYKIERVITIKEIIKKILIIILSIIIVIIIKRKKN